MPSLSFPLDVASLPRFLPPGNVSELFLFDLFSALVRGLARLRAIRLLGSKDVVPLPVAGGLVAPISMSESSVSAGTLVAPPLTGARVARMHPLPPGDLVHIPPECD